MAKANATKISVGFQETSIFGASDSRVTLNVTSSIIDRMAGASLVDDIWADKENVEFIVHRMQGRIDLRDSIAQVFMSGAGSKIFTGLIGTKTFKTGGVQDVKTGSYDQCLAVVGDSEQALVVNEFVLPLLISNGLVSNTTRFAVRRKVPYGQVTLADISMDLMKQEIAKAIGAAKKAFVIPQGTHSTAAIAEQFGDVLRNIGIALSIINDYDNVLNDIVLGVLANIDPAPLSTQLGSVPRELREHAVVQQLATNWVFVQAALRLRQEVAGAEGPSNGITVSCSQYIFDKHAPVILAMLRSSDRYQMVSRSQLISSIGMNKVFGLDGIPRSSVIYDNVAMEATAMVVISVPDATMDKAVNLSELPDRVSERVMSAYGSLAERTSVQAVARCLTDVLELAIESASPNDKMTIDPLYMIRLNSLSGAIDTATIAVMLAERVSARFDDSDSGTKYTLVYSAQTPYANLKLNAGSVLAGTITTTDPAEFLLGLPAIDPTAKIIAPAQLLPRNALRSRLLGYSEDDFITCADRGGYKIDALGVNVSGVIRLKELTSIRMGELATLVVPFHNSQVYSMVDAAVLVIYDLAQKIGDEAAKRRAVRTVAQFALKAAQGLAPSFRSEIHNAVMERAAEKLSYDDSIKMRASMRQHAMTAFTDILAASVFLKLQGMSDGKTMFDQLSADKDVISHWIELGSDRV